MPILEAPLTRKELGERFCRIFEGMVKAVVDLGSERLAVEAVMHADLEQEFLDQGSAQPNLWGLNLYPGKEGDAFLEFTSLINIRPSQGNPSLVVQDPALRERIATLVKRWISDA